MLDFDPLLMESVMSFHVLPDEPEDDFINGCSRKTDCTLPAQAEGSHSQEVKHLTFS